MQINTQNINNQIDTYPSKPEIKTFYINNNKNTNIIETSITKDKANTLLKILNNLNEIDLLIISYPELPLLGTYQHDKFCNK